MTEKIFVEELKKLGYIIDDNKLKQLKKYYELLVEWNEKINLTSIIEEEQVYLKHFYDSATITKVIDLKDYKNICDVGTGAGFPGIVIKILFPDLEVTLVDSLNKRIDFLNIVIKELGLEKIQTVHARSEDFAINNREVYEIVTARAVASLPILLEYCVPMVKKNFFFIPFKGNISQELLESRNALKLLNCEIVDTLEFILPFEESARAIIKIKKNSNTDKKFPRKYAEIKKRPL